MAEKLNNLRLFLIKIDTKTNSKSERNAPRWDGNDMKVFGPKRFIKRALSDNLSKLNLFYFFLLVNWRNQSVNEVSVKKAILNGALSHKKKRKRDRNIKRQFKNSVIQIRKKERLKNSKINRSVNSFEAENETAMKDFNWRSSRNLNFNMKSSVAVLILLITVTTKVSWLLWFIKMCFFLLLAVIRH